MQEEKKNMYNARQKRERGKYIKRMTFDEREIEKEMHSDEEQRKDRKRCTVVIKGKCRKIERKGERERNKQMIRKRNGGIKRMRGIY